MTASGGMYNYSVSELWDGWSIMSSVSIYVYNRKKDIIITSLHEKHEHCTTSMDLVVNNLFYLSVRKL